MLLDFAAALTAGPGLIMIVANGDASPGRSSLVLAAFCGAGVAERGRVGRDEFVQVAYWLAVLPRGQCCSQVGGALVKACGGVGSGERDHLAEDPAGFVDLAYLGECLSLGEHCEGKVVDVGGVMDRE
jgi:hypothetical protein